LALILTIALGLTMAATFPVLAHAEVPEETWGRGEAAGPGLSKAKTSSGDRAILGDDADKVVLPEA
jgi:hypothetical protein